MAEVCTGMRPKDEQKTLQLLRSRRLYPITFEIAELAGRLKRTYAERGVTLPIPDAMIAATAIQNGLALITDDRKDFPCRNWSIMSWCDPTLSRHKFPRFFVRHCSSTFRFSRMPGLACRLH